MAWQPQHVADLAIKQQADTGTHCRALELDTSSAIKTQPSVLKLAFPGKVRYRSPLPIPSTRWNISDLQYQA